MFQMFCCFCFHCRTGTNQRTSQILMPRSPMTGMMRWMASGSHRWSRTLNTRCISSDSNSSCSQDLFCAIFLSFAHQRALQKYLLCLHCQPLCVLTPVSLCVFAVRRVSGSPERLTTLPTRASGSTLRLTTPSTRPILRSINTAASG